MNARAPAVVPEARVADAEEPDWRTAGLPPAAPTAAPPPPTWEQKHPRPPLWLKWVWSWETYHALMEAHLNAKRAAELGECIAEKSALCSSLRLDVEAAELALARAFQECVRAATRGNKTRSFEETLAHFEAAGFPARALAELERALEQQRVLRSLRATLAQEERTAAQWREIVRKLESNIAAAVEGASTRVAVEASRLASRPSVREDTLDSFAEIDANMSISRQNDRVAAANMGAFTRGTATSAAKAGDEVAEMIRAVVSAMHPGDAPPAAQAAQAAAARAPSAYRASARASASALLEAAGQGIELGGGGGALER